MASVALEGDEGTTREGREVSGNTGGIKITGGSKASGADVEWFDAVDWLEEAAHGGATGGDTAGGSADENAKGPGGGVGHRGFWKVLKHIPLVSAFAPAAADTAAAAAAATATEARDREEAAAITVQSVQRGRVARRSVVDRKAGLCTGCSSSQFTM